MFGPGADGARIEGSKAYMKDLALRAGLPTARHGVFDEVEPALAFLRTLPGLYVVKTDGLAAGKGVFVTESLAEAEDDVRAKLAGTAFGDAGRRVVIEEGLRGPEVSVFAVCDGDRRGRAAAGAGLQAGRRRRRGPEHGRRSAPGRRSRSSTPASPRTSPTASSGRPCWRLRDDGIDYRGVLYAGLMVTAEGPKLIEYNVRFGDPDSQVVLLRATSDLDRAARRGGGGTHRDRAHLRRRRRRARRGLAEGYPGPTRTGDPIEGLDAARRGRGRRGAHGRRRARTRMGGS